MDYIKFVSGEQYSIEKRGVVLYSEKAKSPSCSEIFLRQYPGEEKAGKKENSSAR
jgi:hypothetical protein